MLDSNLYDNTPFYILKNIVGLVERFLNLELKKYHIEIEFSIAIEI